MGDRHKRCYSCCGVIPLWSVNQEFCNYCFDVAIKFFRAEQGGTRNDGLDLNLDLKMFHKKLGEDGVIASEIKVANVIKHGPMPNQGDS